VSKQGFSVIVAGPDLAKAMPKTFKQGHSYIVASATMIGEKSKANSTAKGAKPSKATAPKSAKPTKASAPKPSRGGSDSVVKFVKANPGTNMTQIEVGTKLPQAEIRNALNVAREAGSIRTEGQRRGLRYFAGGVSPPTAGASAPAAEATSEQPAVPKTTSNQSW
jgi:hypothetical protein